MTAVMLIAFGAVLQSVAIFGSFIRLGANLRDSLARRAFRVATGVGVLVAVMGLVDVGRDFLPLWFRATGLTLVAAFWVIGSPVLAPRKHRLAAFSFSVAMATAIGVLLVAHLTR
jgi:hypothetical protein